MTILISFNKDLFLLLLLLIMVAQGIIYVVAGIFMKGDKKPDTFGQYEVIAGTINILVVIIVLIL